MVKFIRVLLLVEGKPCDEVTIDCTRNLHESEVYAIMEKMFPAYLFLDTHSDDQCGYRLIFKNGAYCVAIYRDRDEEVSTPKKEEHESGVYSKQLTPEQAEEYLKG